MNIGKLDKRIWLLIGILIGGVVVYFALIFPFFLNRDVTAKLELEEQRYNNYLKLIGQKPEKDGTLKRFIRKKEKFNNRLLESDKPPVVAARLQNTLKEMASDEGIDIISEKQKSIVEQDSFIEVPVEITLKCSITKLSNLIYAIEDYKKFLDISKLSIRVVNIRKPIDVRADLTVSGYIFAQDVSKEN